jgi:hypothetical protein
MGVKPKQSGIPFGAGNDKSRIARRRWHTDATDETPACRQRQGFSQIQICYWLEDSDAKLPLDTHRLMLLRRIGYGEDLDTLPVICFMIANPMSFS